MNSAMTKESSFVKSRAKMFACKSEDETTVVSSETTTTTTSMRKKSYINISCSVSGYNGLNSYDSKARDSSRERLVPLVTKSRDSSPSPTTMTSTAVWTPVAGNRKSTGFLLSPTATDSPGAPSSLLQQSPIVVLPPHRQQSSSDNKSNGSSSQIRSKSVDRGFLRQNFLNGYLHSKPPPSSSGSAISGPESRGRLRMRGSTVPQEAPSRLKHGESDENDFASNSKSVIQQRIERLYGPAALAGGFLSVKSPSRTTTTPMKGLALNNNKNSLTNGGAGDDTIDCSSAATPPVFRHLNAEFRQQLKLKNRSPSVEKSAPFALPPTPIVLSQEVDYNGVTGSRIAHSEEKEDGHKFLRIMADERMRIECLIAKYELYLLEPAVVSSEESTGKIHAAVGKAKLLLAQKFKQFEGLCQKNLNPNEKEPFPTTGQDLAGFWDMVMIQVDHIKTLFTEIQQLRDNGWVEAIPATIGSGNRQKTTKSTSGGARKTSTGNAPTRSAKAEEVAKAREETRRKMMEDRRKMMKAASTKIDDQLESFMIVADKSDIPKEESPTLV